MERMLYDTNVIHVERLYLILSCLNKDVRHVRLVTCVSSVAGKTDIHVCFKRKDKHLG